MYEQYGSKQKSSTVNLDDLTWFRLFPIHADLRAAISQPTKKQTTLRIKSEYNESNQFPTMIICRILYII